MSVSNAFAAQPDEVRAVVLEVLGKHGHQVNGGAARARWAGHEIDVTWSPFDIGTMVEYKTPGPVFVMQDLLVRVRDEMRQRGIGTVDQWERDQPLARRLGDARRAGAGPPNE